MARVCSRGEFQPYKERTGTLVGRPLLRFLLVTAARENGKPGIFRETRIGMGEFAEIEDGALGRFDAARMQALGAKARGGGTCLLFGRRWHSGRIAQVKGQALGEVQLTTN